MRKIQNFNMSLVLIILIFGSGLAQNQTNLAKVSTYRDLVRFTALQEFEQVRLEIRTLQGEKIFDSEFVPGVTVDWFRRDQQGRSVSKGHYSYVLFTKDKAGTLIEQKGIAQHADLVQRVAVLALHRP